MRIKNYFLFYLILNIFMVSIAFAQDKEEIVTNSVVVDMVKAKLGETIIINKIKSSKTNFDLSTNTLIKLKEAGVSDNIVNAMMEAQNPQPQQTGQQAKDASMSLSGDVFTMQGGKLVEMEYVAGFTKNMSSPYTMGFSMKTKFVIMASGEHASMRIKDKQPAFYMKLHPSEIGLVKFDTDTYNKKIVRYVLRVGEMWQTGGQAGAPGQGNIDFEYKKEPNGIYKIALKNPLEKGEYGFIAAGISSGAGPWTPSSSYKIYDFGVEE